MFKLINHKRFICYSFSIFVLSSVFVGCTHKSEDNKEEQKLNNTLLNSADIQLSNTFVINNVAGGNSTDEVKSMVAVNDGWLVVGDSVSSNGQFDLSVLKLNSQGELDSTFGQGTGISNVAIANGDGYNVQNIASLSDGSFVVVGKTKPNGNDDMTVWKFQSNGELDSNFGSNGVFTYDAAAGAANKTDYSAAAIGLDDGGWLVVGSSFNSKYYMVIWKFTAAGALDTQFGDGNGVYVYQNSDTLSYYATDIAIDSDGNWLIAGLSDDGSVRRISAWKFNAAGQLDMSFGGGDGIFTTTETNKGESTNALAIDDNGGIAISGYALHSVIDMQVWKLTSEGVLDTSFGGGDGIFSIIGSQNQVAQTIAWTPSGGWVAAGYSNRNGIANDSEMVVWKLTPNGELDLDYNQTGISYHDNTAGSSGNDIAQAITINSNGEWTIAGNSRGLYQSDMTVWWFK